MEWVVFEGVQFRQRDFLNLVAGGLERGRAKQFIQAGHLDFCRAAFHDATSKVRASYAADTLPEGSCR